MSFFWHLLAVNTCAYAPCGKDTVNIKYCSTGCSNRDRARKPWAAVHHCTGEGCVEVVPRGVKKCAECRAGARAHDVAAREQAVPQRSTSLVGSISLAGAAFTLHRAGVRVATTMFGEEYRWDLLVEDIDGSTAKVQVKTAKIDRTQSYLSFSTASSDSHGGRGARSYRGQVDYIIAYSQELDRLFVVRPEQAPSRMMTLRLASGSRRQQQSTNLASTYEFAPGKSLKDQTKNHLTV